MLSTTLPISFLFAVLLSFGRLNADGEFTAFLSAGYSLARASVPVILIGVILYAIGAVSSTFLEPWANREFKAFYHRKAQTEIDNIIKFKLQAGTFLDDFLGYVLYAEKISPDHTRFENVMLSPRNNGSNQKFTLLAPTGSIYGSIESGEFKMTFDYGVIYSAKKDISKINIVKFKKAEIDLLRIFQNKIFGSDIPSNNYNAYPPSKLSKYIDNLKKDYFITKNPQTQKTYLRARYLFNQRIAMPFAIIIFGLFAISLGISDLRRGRSNAYIGAITTIILSYIVLMGFKWLAEQNYISAPLGAWLPNIILLSIAVFFLYQKNRLPPSESALNPMYIPGLKKIFKQ